MNYYDILGVAKNATPEEIKKAFKKKAMQHHPDKGGNADQFKQINEAFQALSDPQQRRTYDQFGTTNPSAGNQNYHFRTGPGGFDINDIFDHFSFGNFGSQFRQNQPRKNRDIKIGITIDFDEIFTGKNTTLSFNLPNGKLEVLDVRIPPGVKDGDVVKFQRYGDDSIPNIPRGDLIVQIRINPIPNWDRRKDDLYTTLTVDIFDLITGCTRKIVTPDKRHVELKIQQGTNPKTMLRINEYGVPNIHNGKRGNLFVEINSTIPKLSPSDIDRLKSFITTLAK